MHRPPPLPSLIPLICPSQELALAHPQKVASAVLYATWGRCDGFQRSILAAFRLPYVVRDMEAALTVSGLAFSPQLLDRPDFQQLLEPMLPAFPRTTSRWRSPWNSGTPTSPSTPSIASAGSRPPPS